MQKLLEYTRAAFAQRLNGDAAFTDGFEQRLNNLLSAGHDEIDAGVQTARFVGAIVPSGEPVGHDDAAVQLSELVRASNAQNTGNVHVEKAKHYLSDHLTQEIRTEDIAAAVLRAESQIKTETRKTGLAACLPRYSLYTENHSLGEWFKESLVAMM